MNNVDLDSPHTSSISSVQQSSSSTSPAGYGLVSEHRKHTISMTDMDVGVCSG